MKKPVLLLVDDDPGVLQALEAELAPVFADIARIEAFDDPRAVLAALPAWKLEARPIAVAIADQKMPGMTGVELLRELRDSARDGAEESFQPALFTRALMLTAYAGLDSAIASLNEGGVCRYLEKPWASNAFLDEVRTAFAAWLGESGWGAHFVMRLASDTHEISDLLRLRYSIYVRSGHLNSIVASRASDAMDLDAYDARSRLFALLLREHDGERVVGGLRVVGQDPSPQLESLKKTVAPHPHLSDTLLTEPMALLPLLEYIPERDVVAVLVQRMLASGEGVAEPGRLVLLEEFRSRLANIREPLARLLIETAVAFFFFFYRIPHAILTCTRDHRAFYRPYGFKLTEGTQMQVYPKLGVEIACLHGTMDSVPDAAGRRCEALEARIRLTGGTCSCAAFPDCLGGPYETGDFVSVDILCPHLATSRMSDAREQPRPAPVRPQ